MFRKAIQVLVPAALVALLVGCGGGDGEKVVPPKAESAGKAPASEEGKAPAATEKKMSMQTTCPCTGMPIDKANFTDYQGKRIYFCSKGCIDTFKKDPDKYMKQMEAAGVMLEKAPASDEEKAPDAGKKTPM
jgi:YHS domain-containing protein